MVIGRSVSGSEARPDEDVRVVRLADLDPAEVDMRCLLIVGSSQTEWHADDFGDRVFTPRRYPAWIGRYAFRAIARKSRHQSK